MSPRDNKKSKKKSPSRQLAPQIQAKFQEGLACHQNGQFSLAQALYEEILAIHPSHFDTLYLAGVLAAQTQKLHRAVTFFDKTIEINPLDANSYFNRGLALQELRRLDAALADYDQAISLDNRAADAFFNRALTLFELKRPAAALASYDQAIALKPDYAEAYNNRGITLFELKQPSAALASYDKAIANRPDYAEAYYNRGITLLELKQPTDALASYEQAIALKPDYAEAYINRGITLFELKQPAAALASYDRAIAIKPDYAEAYFNRGITLFELKQPAAALASYDQAVAIKPDYAEAHFNRGNVLNILKDTQAALESFDQALALKPNYDFLHGIRLHLKMQNCEWRDAEANLAELINKIQHNEKASTPGHLLTLSSSLTTQRQAAAIWITANFPENTSLGKIGRRQRHEKIRIGYFSADFHDHATTRLMAELFELHDRNRFEIIAFSYGPETTDEMRLRLLSAFDKFIEVQNYSDQEVANLSRNLEIDIAVDLKGFTDLSRVGIFSYRAAPIQVNYLGYPGTMAADYIDYLIADQTLIPEESQQYYSEKIVYLPHSYQVNDSKRRISPKAFTRKELGLPESGFVFCCLNNNYKITPSIFDVWSRILKKVEGSVLWLYVTNSNAAKNLRTEFILRGGDAERLVFAEPMPQPEHLARQRVADLFLDTLPCNSHTTASDALWAGLPVLTCTGEALASRVAASLLKAIDLPELIVSTLPEYEALAVELATDPERFAAIKKKLEINRLCTPLFDTKLFTRHIEKAYTLMFARYHAGLAPDQIYVESF